MNLSSTKITDAALPLLFTQRPSELNLSDTMVTVEGMSKAAQVSNWQNIRVSVRQFTAKQLVELSDAGLNVSVTGGGWEK